MALVAGDRTGMTHRTALKVIVACALVAGLGGCREAEQGRPIEHTPGVYTGKKDQPLSEAQREELRERTLLQSGRR